MLGSKNQFSVLNTNATDDQLGKMPFPSVRDAISNPSVSERLQRAPLQKPYAHRVPVPSHSETSCTESGLHSGGRVGLYIP